MSLRTILYLSRNVGLSKRFFVDGLKLKVEVESSALVRLQTKNGVPVEIIQATSEAQCSVGYSPFVNFEVDNMDEAVPALIQLGGHLDGPLLHQPYGTVAAIRGPDGQMIGLFEKADNVSPQMMEDLAAVEGLSKSEIPVSQA